MLWIFLVCWAAFPRGPEAISKALRACRVSPFFLGKDLLACGQLLAFGGSGSHPGGWRAAAEAGRRPCAAPFSISALPSPFSYIQCGVLRPPRQLAWVHLVSSHLIKTGLLNHFTGLKVSVIQLLSRRVRATLRLSVSGWSHQKHVKGDLVVFLLGRGSSGKVCICIGWS